MYCGGRGANQAPIPARLGSKILMISKLRNNIFGKKCQMIEQIFPLCDIICHNGEETELLTSLPVLTLDEVKIAGRTLLEKGVNYVIITLGK